MARFATWRPTRTGIIFIVVALLLAGAVFAGAWFVQQRGEQVRQQEAAEIAQQNLENESETPVIAEEEAEDAAPTNEGAVQSTTDASEGQVAANSPEALPATGGEIVPLLATFLLTLTAAAYVVSRRQLQARR